jgi:cytoskeletal protein RodZ
MPFNSDTLHYDSREEFCLALKAAREQQGITLGAIAEATKIPADLFAALERCDLRRWPNGLFRRSFFRDYARTLGLPVSDLCREFLRLFPDEDAAAAAQPDAKPEPAPPPTLRQSLARWFMGAGSTRISVRLKLPK